MLEIARLLSRSHERTRATIVFVLFSGEEEGDLGSAWYADHPVVPMDSTLAMLNLDMVGRLRDDKLLVLGVKTATEWQPLLDSVNAAYHLDVHASGDGWGASDQASFFAKHRPVLFFFTDLHADYHRPSDTWDKINAGGLATVAAFAADVAGRLAVRSGPLTFVDAPVPQMASGTRAYLGTIPDMTGEPGGVRLSGVSAGSPADSGGLKAGDVLVGIGADTVANLNDMQNALVKHHPGDTVSSVCGAATSADGDLAGGSAPRRGQRETLDRARRPPRGRGRRAVRSVGGRRRPHGRGAARRSRRVARLPAPAVRRAGRGSHPPLLRPARRRPVRGAARRPAGLARARRRPRGDRRLEDRPRA